MTRNFDIDAYIHVFNRGAKKMPIHRQKSDLWRLLFNLFYLNSKHVPDNWARELERKNSLSRLEWPAEWPERKPLVSVLAFSILPNHFHLILKEITKDGVSDFMHKFTMSYSKFINAKYDESGSLFQGKYKSVVATEDVYLRYLAAYVMVKNTFELYPYGGLEGAIHNFDDAYVWAIEHPFTSLADYAGFRTSPIIEKDILGEIFENPDDFKLFAKDCILGRNVDKNIYFDR